MGKRKFWIPFIFEQYLKFYVNFLQNDWVSWLFSTEFVIDKHVFETTQCIFFKLIQNNTPKWDWSPIFSSTNLWISKKKLFVNEFVEKMNMWWVEPIW